jgi:hypothetical protein
VARASNAAMGVAPGTTGVATSATGVATAAAGVASSAIGVALSSSGVAGSPTAIGSSGVAVSSTRGASVATTASVGVGGGASSPQAARIKIAVVPRASIGSRGRVERRTGIVEPLRGRRADLPRSPGQRANGVAPCRHRTAMFNSSQAVSSIMS